jgi:hypothetical protein
MGEDRLLGVADYRGSYEKLNQKMVRRQIPNLKNDCVS